MGQGPLSSTIKWPSMLIDLHSQNSLTTEWLCMQIGFVPYYFTPYVFLKSGCLKEFTRGLITLFRSIEYSMIFPHIQIHNNVTWDRQYSTEYPQKFPTFSLNMENIWESSVESYQSHITLLRIWIMLCLHLRRLGCNKFTPACEIWRRTKHARRSHPLPPSRATKAP